MMMRIAGVLSAFAVMAQAAEVPSFTNTDDYDELNLNFRFLQKNGTEESGPTKAPKEPQEEEDAPVVEEVTGVKSSLALEVPANLSEEEKETYSAALAASTKKTVADALTGIEEKDVVILSVTFSGRRLTEGRRLSTQTVTIDFVVVPPTGVTLAVADFDTAMSDSDAIMTAFKENVAAADASIDTSTITGTIAVASASTETVTVVVTSAPSTAAPTTAAPAPAPAPAAAAPAPAPASNAFTVSAISAVFIAAALA